MEGMLGKVIELNYFIIIKDYLALFHYRIFLPILYLSYIEIIIDSLIGIFINM